MSFFVLEKKNFFLSPADALTRHNLSGVGVKSHSTTRERSEVMHDKKRAAGVVKSASRQFILYRKPQYLFISLRKSRAK